MNPQTFQIVETFDYLTDADLLKAKLESEGIPVLLKDSYVMQTNPFMTSALGGVKVMVPLDYIERATAIYNEIRPYAQDELGKTVQCPNCNNPTTISYLRRDTIWHKLFPFLTPKAYKCLTCGIISSGKI
ncbi:MAG: hypothetical protein RLZZ241_1532 [Bacteroidota bacterium]|jgi:DNA-directed RNA polymerase subunit RPC12/RpoP